MVDFNKSKHVNIFYNLFQTFNDTLYIEFIKHIFF
jgi:hypothetical protein